MAIPARKRYTVAEYLAFEEKSESKHEYHDGELVALAGASNAHNIIVAHVISLLDHALRRKPYVVYPSDMRVMTEDDELYTYPDVSVVCGKPAFTKGRDDTITNPLLIVEVLSHETRSYDRGRKFDLYRRIRSLQDYLLVEQQAARVEYFHRLDDGTWPLTEIEGLEGQVKLQAIVLCGVPCGTPRGRATRHRIGVTLKLRDIYAKVGLSPTSLVV